MFNLFTMFFAVPRGDDLETLARRARARYDAMSPADRRAHDEAQRASFVRGNLGVDNPGAAERFEKRRLEQVLDRMSEEFNHPSYWPRPARLAPPSTTSGYSLAAAEDRLSKLIGLPITQEMRDRFYADVAKGQSAYDDAGTTYERHYRAMLGLPVEEPVTHREFVKAVIDGEFRKPSAADTAKTPDKKAAFLEAERAVVERLEKKIGSLETALRTTESAIAEFHRYWHGGEIRGSYDGRPERDGLWKALYAARSALAAPSAPADPAPALGAAKADLLAAALAYIENVGDYEGRYATLRSAAKGYRDAERRLACEGKE